MKKLVFKLIAKTEYLLYALVILLWAIGAVLTILSFPWITLGIVGLHFFELITIGLKAGKNGGEGFFYSVAMCMMFGFCWWVPLKVKTNQVDF